MSLVEGEENIIVDRCDPWVRRMPVLKFVKRRETVCRLSRQIGPAMKKGVKKIVLRMLSVILEKPGLKVSEFKKTERSRRDE